MIDEIKFVYKDFNYNWNVIICMNWFSNYLIVLCNFMLKIVYFIINRMFYMTSALIPFNIFAVFYFIYLWQTFIRTNAEQKIYWKKNRQRYSMRLLKQGYQAPAGCMICLLKLKVWHPVNLKTGAKVLPSTIVLQKALLEKY